MKNNKKKLLLLKIAITLFIFIISWIFNKFDLNLLKTSGQSTFLYYFLRFTFLGALFITISKLTDFIVKLKNKDKLSQKRLKFFIIVLSILAIFLLLVWPGIWSWDEFFILEDSSRIVFSTWQSYLTVIFYSHCLMLLFRPEIVVIVQILFISYVISYIMTTTWSLLKRKGLTYLLLIPLLLPAVLINNYYPLRLTMYSYIELLLLFKMVLVIKGRLPLDFKQVLSIVFMVFVVATWRTEAIYYLLMYVLLWILLDKKKRKYLYVSIAIVGVLYSPIYYLQKSQTLDTSLRYKVTAVINPLSMMLQEKLDGDVKDNLEEINRVLNVEQIKKYPSYIEIPSYWNGAALQPDFTNNFNMLYKGYADLVLDNIDSFFAVRMKTYLSTNGFDKYEVISINDFKTRIAKDNRWYAMLNRSCISKKIRNSFIRLYASNNTTWKIIFWDTIPFVLLMIGLLIRYIFKKKWAYSVLLCFVLLRVPLVFATAAANYFMYYFPTYLVGSYILILLIIKSLENRKKELK